MTLKPLDPTSPSSFFSKISELPLKTSINASRMLKWNAGVNAFRLLFHLAPENGNNNVKGRTMVTLYFLAAKKIIFIKFFAVLAYEACE